MEDLQFLAPLATLDRKLNLIKQHLLRPQSLYRINRRSTPCWNHRSNPPSYHQNHNRGCHNPCIRTGDLIKLRLHKSNAKQRHREPDHESNRRLQQRPPQYHCDHSSAPCSQRHADANLRNPPHEPYTR